MTHENFDPSSYPLDLYIRHVDITEDWLSLRSTEFPPESVPCDRPGRYHKAGEVAYYAASGMQTACAEKYNDPNARVAHDHQAYGIPSGAYEVFDAREFIKHYPEAGPLLTGSSYDAPQVMREALSDRNCSGIIYPSAKSHGGVNLAVWPLDNSPFVDGSFFQPGIKP